MNGVACPCGWIDTDLRNWLNNTFINEMPDELTQHIPGIAKITHNGAGEEFATVDRLFILSESEMFGSAIYSDYEDGPRYEAFATSELRVRHDEDGDRDWYWTRSQYGGYSTYFASVSGHGHAGSLAASTAAIRVPLCFCLA